MDSSGEFTLESILPVSEDFSGGLSGTVATSAAADLPSNIGRYRIEAELGAGGFGRVYRAYDDQLKRLVAIKVPHLFRATSPEALERYLEEARTLARLEHPSIVRVHDVGTTDNGLPFLVSNYVEGKTLAQALRSKLVHLGRAIEIVIAVAKALSYVHANGVIHRDIKPGNILLNNELEPYLADFGVALREDVPQGDWHRVGTPAFMSPEQARGEAHLVDGRSDIYSLGVVLYQMITGKLPFGGDSREDVIKKVIHKAPTPLRQLNSQAPRELERICMKAIAKRPSDRYNSASDFVEDLQHYLDSEPKQFSGTVVTDDTPESTDKAVGIVPRGLRSFDRHDAEFFQQLLPGPHSREWVPESLEFWRRRLLNTEEEAVRVGVIYGPSGCGKSSFVKAGLLPFLKTDSEVVFVEATSSDTEARILRGVRKRFPFLSAHSGLKESIADVRRMGQEGDGRKLLIVVDQFEQWLNGREELESAELTFALRHCDGVSVQCLILIRDDFWLAMSRFASLIEVPLKQNQNIMLVDLFTQAHAKQVLRLFGAAYGCLPEKPSERTEEQEKFIDRAVRELSEFGRVIPVRLSVFVEMVKTRPWTISTLDELGGVAGIGVLFLEDSLSNRLAPASQRVHEQAARKVLRRLLPEQGGNLKGTMRSESELRSEANYDGDEDAFDALIHVLDNELRLITPTDPAGALLSDESQTGSTAGVPHYQLTHDFLVPALNDWLNKKQRETRRGRLELRLSEYASLWKTKPLAKFGPSWLEWLSIRTWSRPAFWSETEARMMRVTGKRHLRNTLLFMAAALTLAFCGYWWNARSQAKATVVQLEIAQNEQLDAILTKLNEDSWQAPSILRSKLATAESGTRLEMLYRLALLAQDPSQADWLVERALDSSLPSTIAIGKQLRSHPPTATAVPGILNDIVGAEQEDPKLLRRFVLAVHTQPAELESRLSRVPEKQAEIVGSVLKHLVHSPQDFLVLREAIRPASHAILDALRDVALGEAESPERAAATGLVVSFTEKDPKALLQFAVAAAVEQYPAILPRLEPYLQDMRGELTEIAFSDIESLESEEAADQQARKKATAAALLHRTGVETATWPLMKSTSRPYARTYIIDRLPRLAEDFGSVVSRFSREPDGSARQALILAMGHFNWHRLPASIQREGLAVIQDAFQNDPNVSVHSAARWMLRRIGQVPWMEERLEQMRGLPLDPRKNWFVDNEGHTMAILDARDDPEIGRVFAIATLEVSVKQFERFRPEHSHYKFRSPTGDCPIGMIHWYDAIGYCRWMDEQHAHGGLEGSYPKELLDEMSKIGNLGRVVSSSAYRLPTAAEWNFACRAHTESSRYFGWNQSLLDDWLWHWDSAFVEELAGVRYWPGDSKHPNSLGFFAMYDGVREWGHDNPRRDGRRAILGRHTGNDAIGFIQENMFGTDLPRARNGMYGFRVAKTLTRE